MRISVFTPTNSGKYLYDAYRSLVEQTYTDWEWILVANGAFEIPPAADRDERVKVFRSTASPGIGYLKRLACSKCTGDLLVEFDHDDLLPPMTLERLRHWQAKSKAGFLYSDCVQFFPDGRSHTFDARYGWESYRFVCRGANSRPSARSHQPLQPSAGWSGPRTTCAPGLARPTTGPAATTRTCQSATTTTWFAGPTWPASSSARSLSASTSTVSITTRPARTPTARTRSCSG